MGCTSSTQTTAQDTTRPSTKGNSSTPETGNENGGPAADSDTIPDQSQAQESSAPDATKETESCDETITSDAAGPVEAVPDQPEEPQTNPSTTDESHEQPAPSENTTEDQKDSSPPENIPENTTEDQTDSSPPEEAPASTEES